jgi:hypothetical protein
VGKEYTFIYNPHPNFLLVFTNRYLKTKIRWALFGSGTL